MTDPNAEAPTTPGEEATPPNEQQDDADAYEPIFFTVDAYPNAGGTIATEFAAVALDQQRIGATQLYEFLWGSAGEDMLRLNVGQALLMALVAIPATHMVKVVFGFGVGLAGIGEVNALQNKLLMLHGDGDLELGPPELMVLNTSCRNKVDVNDPQDDQIQELLKTKGKHFGRHLIAP